MYNARPMTKATEPKKLLEQLEAGALIDGFSAEDVASARALIGAPSPAAQDVERLPEPLALAVLESAVRRRNVELASALAGAHSKGLAKAAKRALYQLRSMGEKVPEPAKAEAPQPMPKPEPADEFPCLLSPVVGTGDRGLVVVRPMRGGGLETYHMALNDELGITHFERFDMGRSAYRKQLREAEKKPFIEISLARSRALVADAWAKKLASRTPLPEGADEALRRLDVRPADLPDDIPQPVDGDAALQLEGHALHDEPEIAAWLPPEREIKLLYERIAEVSASPLALSDQQKQQQLSQKIRQTAEEFFTPERKRLYGRRLWAMAEYFESQGRKKPAEIARAEARRLFHGVSGVSRFSEFLFEKVLILTARMQAGQELPAPTERLSSQPPEEKRSSGGLILP